jgi:hypothetical protein
VIFALLVLLVPVAAVAAEEPKFSGGDGSSCEEAVVPQATEGTTLAQAQHRWLLKTYGGGALVGQVLGASTDGKRRYDVMAWRRPDGQTVHVCFDVTTVFEETIRRIEDGDTHRPPR